MLLGVDETVLVARASVQLDLNPPGFDAHRAPGGFSLTPIEFETFNQHALAA